MQGYFYILIFAVMTTACGTSGSKTASCTTQKKQNPLKIEDGTETNQFPSVVLVMSGNPTGRMMKCTGTIVGHNSVLTAAHCIGGGPESMYVMQTGSLTARDYSAALMAAVKPRAIISHGAIEPPNPSGVADISKFPDDLVVLVFANNTFRNRDVVIPSLNDIQRPTQFSKATMVGFGKSSANDTSSSSIKRMGLGFYLVHDAFYKDLVFSFNRDLDQSTLMPEGPKKFSQGQQGDSGGPLFVDGENSLRIVGVLSGGGTSQDGATSRSIYVDLYSQRSLALLAKASSEGAKFTSKNEAFLEPPSGPSASAADAEAQRRTCGL